MNRIKRLLFSILSEQQYLRLLHRGFYALLDLGLLKGNRKFKFHYKIYSIIKKKDVVLDIGANLGYFAKSFSRLAKEGKVICVEPLPQYYEVLNFYLGKKKNIKIHNVALGKEAGTVTMVLPMQNGMIRTGLPHISNEITSNKERTQDVELVNPLSLLNNETKLDYIKCDVEGYEWVIFQELKPALAKYLPTIQIEIDPSNIEKLLPFFRDLGYVQYGISQFKFIREDGAQNEPGDYLFVHKTKESRFLERTK